MLDIRFERFHLKSASFEHVPPFARAILANVRLVMIGIQAIHAFIKEVILRYASIIDDDHASAAQNAPHFTKCLPDVGKMMRRPPQVTRSKHLSPCGRRCASPISNVTLLTALFFRSRSASASMGPVRSLPTPDRTCGANENAVCPVPVPISSTFQWD